ncbi:FMRFamide receptor-like [Lineus longissimus]|uniref:FMRFamide receptor-like n=1 Tax=Lineus longissimus TaxID=88925 RepID=UPI00315CC2B7
MNTSDNDSQGFDFWTRNNKTFIISSRDIPSSCEGALATWHGNALFITLGCILGVVALVGIIANILSIVVFSRMTHKSSTTFLIQMLAFVDSVFLLANILVFTLFNWFSALGYLCSYLVIFSSVLPYLWGFLEIARDYAVWLVPVVTLERYVAIYYPLSMSKFCRITIAWKILLGLFLYVIVFNVPSFLQYTKGSYNMDIKGKITAFSLSALNTNPIYNTTYFIVDSVMNLLLPVVLVCFMNCRIIMVLKRARTRTKKRGDFKRGQSEPDRGSFATMMLVTIAIVFVVCELPKVVESCFVIWRKWERTVSVTQSSSKANDHWFIIFIISTLSQAFNSFINFFVYCLTGRRFRRVLRTTLSLSDCKRRLCPDKDSFH